MLAGKDNSFFLFFFPVESPLLIQKWFYAAFPSLFDTLAYRPDYWKESLWLKYKHGELWVNYMLERVCYMLTTVKIKCYSLRYTTFFPIRDEIFFRCVLFN